MIKRSLEGRLDMVVGSRVESEQAAYRAGHRTGNKLQCAFVALVFDSPLTDVLSGLSSVLTVRKIVSSFIGRF